MKEVRLRNKASSHKLERYALESLRRNDLFSAARDFSKAGEYASTAGKPIRTRLMFLKAAKLSEEEANAYIARNGGISISDCNLGYPAHLLHAAGDDARNAGFGFGMRSKELYSGAAIFFMKSAKSSETSPGVRDYLLRKAELSVKATGDSGLRLRLDALKNALRNQQQEG